MPTIVSLFHTCYLRMFTACRFPVRWPLKRAAHKVTTNAANSLRTVKASSSSAVDHPGVRCRVCVGGWLWDNVRALLNDSRLTLTTLSSADRLRKRYMFIMINFALVVIGYVLNSG
jgi:hypothetical protein